MKRIWKAIKDAPEFSISNDGIIRNDKYPNVLIKPNRFGRRGYLREWIHSNGKTIEIYPHIEVAKAFIGKIKKGQHVHHIDNVKTNNRVDNLEIIDAGKHCSKTRSESNGIPEEIVERICKELMHPDVFSINNIAETYLCSRMQIVSIYKKKAYKHITKQYDFPERNDLKHSKGKY